MTGWQKWVPDAVAGLAVLALGLIEVNGNGLYPSPGATMFVIVAVALAVGLSRARPGVALGITWLAGAVHLAVGIGPLVCEVFLAVVAFGCARWGRTAVVWASGLSIPFWSVLAVWWLDTDFVYAILYRTGVKEVAELAYRGGDWRVNASVMMLALLAVPWLAGLVLRFSQRARLSQQSQIAAEEQRDQAEEIARLREEQAQLARDVHDVVGHSLAVILAQAESAQYLDDVDTQRLKKTMDNIATSARTSLDDVRQVLASTSGQPHPRTRNADLDSLVDGVRASGHDVVSTEVGDPQPMPPELEVVAFRVLQEMLTNAIKHGRRGEPVRVERHWEGDLRIEVQNALDVPVLETQPLVQLPEAPEPPAPPAPPGQGLEGMRRRLEAVGGRLDVRRRTEPATFTATAWVPVRAR